MKNEFSIGNLVLKAGKPKLLTHVGTTYNVSTPEKELEKALVAVENGVDIIADVSLGENCYETLRLLTENISSPITALPGYILATQDNSSELKENITENEILEITEKTLNYGIKGFTIHSAFRKKHLKILKNSKRIFPFSSRMGNYIKKYMEKTEKENPFYTCFPSIVSLAKKYNATISIGTALRSPSVVNNGGFDNLLKEEIIEMSKLVKVCVKEDVNVMIEGIGHITIDKIDEWYDFSKEICGQEIPLRVLPIVTDRGMGHDNITGAIAAAFLARKGVEVISIITRAEHIGHPSLEDIKESVINFKIALAAAIYDGKAELKVAKARNEGGCHLRGVIENIIDSEGVKELLRRRNYYVDYSECSMCGESCPLKREDLDAKIGKSS